MAEIFENVKEQRHKTQLYSMETKVINYIHANCL